MISLITFAFILNLACADASNHDINQIGLFGIVKVNNNNHKYNFENTFNNEILRVRGGGSDDNDKYDNYEIEMYHQPSSPQNFAQYCNRLDRATEAHLHAKVGDLEALQHLASTSNNPRSLCMESDKNGWQPIHEAIRGNYLDIVEFLLRDQKVDVFATTRSGDTPLSLSRQLLGEDDPITQLILQIIDEQQ